MREITIRFTVDNKQYQGKYIFSYNIDYKYLAQVIIDILNRENDTRHTYSSFQFFDNSNKEISAIKGGRDLWGIYDMDKISINELWEQEGTNIRFEIGIFQEVLYGTNLSYKKEYVDSSLMYNYSLKKFPRSILFDSHLSKEIFYQGKKAIYLCESNGKNIYRDDRNRNYIMRMNVNTEKIEAGFINPLTNVLIVDPDFLDFPHNKQPSNQKQYYRFKDSDVNFYDLA